MTTVITCSTLAEAQLLRSLLVDAGIAAHLPEELTANAAPQLVFGSGIRVQVEDEDADEAHRVLAAAVMPPTGGTG
jgi:pyrroline-5-carboxylate reductase